MKISFIGLGCMGHGMAMNLSKCNYDYLVCDIDEGKLLPYKEKGIITSTDISDTYDSDLIFLCLPASKNLLLAREGLLSHLDKGQILVDSGTMHYQDAREIGKKFLEKGVEYIDAPVAGRAERSIKGTLTIMCGGSKQAFDIVEPFLEYMGESIFYLGLNGSGQIAKMINNIISYITLSGLCEVLPLATKLGLEPEQLANLINSSTAQSHVSSSLIPHILEGNFKYDTMNACYKNVLNIQQISNELRVPLPTVNAMTENYKLAMAKGYGEDYYTSMIKHYEELLDVKFRYRE